MKSIVLFLSHYCNENLIKNFKRLKDELPKSCDIVWAYNKDNDLPLPPHIPFYAFTTDSVYECEYHPMDRKIYYGESNYILHKFYKENSGYDYYWVIEYDVYFTGKWSDLLMAFEQDDSDLLSSHIERYSEKNHYWEWWNHIRWTDCKIPLEKRLKSFNPIYRLSARAIDFMDKFYCCGGAGHYEVVMPTILFNAGFKLQDFGGTGEFVVPKNRNRFYVQGFGTNNGTMRFRPIFMEEEVEALQLKNKLIHPLKC